MPKIPSTKRLNANSVDILNTIRDNASPEYRNIVPAGVQNTDSIRAIGEVLMQYQPMQNEFLHALVNRIGRVILTSKLYTNPWSMFKKGLLEFGETVEEIFVNITQPHQFDPVVAENEVFKREIPDVRAAFHTMNYQKFYKSTVSNDQLRQAFLSWDGITDLIARIVDAMYTSAAKDEFLTMKYLLARRAISGGIGTQAIPTVSADNSNEIVTAVKALSNKLTFLSPDYNVAGVETYTRREDQIVLINSDYEAIMNVETLASAFNIDRVTFMGQLVLVDSFGFSNSDLDRLDLLLSENPGYVRPSAEEIELLNNIPIIVLDRDWFMIFDNFYNFTENYNGQGLYWNYWYHTWKTFSVSPFANAAMFIQGEPAVTSVTVSPTSMTITKGQTGQFTATVETTNFAPDSVIWSLTGATAVTSTIDAYGRVAVDTTEGNTTLTVTATSTFDTTKTGTSAITVA